MENSCCLWPCGYALMSSVFCLCSPKCQLLLFVPVLDVVKNRRDPERRGLPGLCWQWCDTVPLPWIQRKPILDLCPWRTNTTKVLFQTFEIINLTFFYRVKVSDMEVVESVWPFLKRKIDFLWKLVTQKNLDKSGSLAITIRPMQTYDLEVNHSKQFWICRAFCLSCWARSRNLRARCCFFS